jgi:hypothetical protein
VNENRRHFRLVPRQFTPVYQGTQRLQPEPGIEVLPLMDFLAEVQRGL